jgi:hypothetical protein
MWLSPGVRGAQRQGTTQHGTLQKQRGEEQQYSATKKAHSIYTRETQLRYAPVLDESISTLNPRPRAAH